MLRRKLRRGQVLEVLAGLPRCTVAMERLLILGANSVVIKRRTNPMAQPGTWLGGLLARKPGMLVRVALANKMARIVWALMARGGVYRAPVVAA